MDNVQFNKLLKQLKNIETKLDLLVKFAKITAPPLKVTGEEKKILKLCNQKNSIDDIMKKTGKTRNTMKVTLAHLRSKGVITSEEIMGKTRV